MYSTVHCTCAHVVGPVYAKQAQASYLHNYVMITQLGVKPQHSLAKHLVSKVAVVVVTTMLC